MKFIVGFLFLVLFQISVSATENHKPNESIFAQAYKANQESKNNKSIDVNQKLKNVITVLNLANEKLNTEQYASLIKDVKEILFSSPSNPQIIIDQQIFLIGLLSRFPGDDIDRLLSLSHLEVMEKIRSSSEEKFCTSTKLQCNKLKDIPFYKGYIAMIDTQRLLQEGKYEEAEITAKIAFNNISIKPDELIDNSDDKDDLKNWDQWKKQFIFISYILKMNIAKTRGNFADVVKEIKIVDEDFYSTVDWLDKNHKNKAILGSYRFVYEVDAYLGKYNEVIKKAKFLLDKIPEDESNIANLKARSILMKDIGDAYNNLKFTELGNRYKYAAWIIDLKTGTEDFNGYGFRIIRFLKANDFQGAEVDISLLDKACESIESYYALNPKVSIPNTDCTVFRPLVKKYFNALKASKNDIERNNAEKDFWLESAVNLELTVALIRPTLDSDAFNTNFHSLAVYALLHDAYLMGGNKYLAAFYAKKYINTLQKLRSELSSLDNQEISVFTDSQSDILKKFSNTFYDIGDLSAAFACLKIIKENEYLDFVRRRGVDSNFLTTIKMSKFEKEYSIKFESIAREVSALETQSMKLSLSSDSSKAKLDQILSKKKQELENLRLDFNKQLLKQSSLSMKDTKSFSFSPISLSANEAFIQYSVLPDAVVIYVNTAKANKKITIPADRPYVRTAALEMNNSLAKKSLIRSDKIIELSSILINEPLNFLSDKNISKIKIRTDDSLSLIPFGLLKYKEIDLGQTFTVEYVGLSGKSKNKLSPPLLTLDAFGATRGNKEFSQLPGVKNEIDTLMNISVNSKFSKNAYLDDKFNFENFIQSFDKKTAFVHIATHFKANGNLANNTKMLLGDGNTVSLEDIRSKLPQISSNLVTLSACDTGQVISSNSGRNAEGLSNVFQIKGAKNVIYTIWSISDDATADFMSIYYSVLLNNEISPVDVLSITQNIYRVGNLSLVPNSTMLKLDKSANKALDNLSKYSHPYYWSAFQISSTN